MTGYPPAQTPQMANVSAGQQYQQQREFLFQPLRYLARGQLLCRICRLRLTSTAVFAMCAAGNHDVTTKYGVFGIIMAVVCFPCGLICLL